jgi:hypothetical protein
VRLAAVAALQQQFGRFRVLQIILRELDAAIDFLPRLDADEHQPTTRGLVFHGNHETTFSTEHSDLDQKFGTARATCDGQSSEIPANTQLCDV